MPQHTREQIEVALDAGKLQTLMTPNNWWTLRRNGRTKLWKCRPNDFRIPVKYSLRGYGYIDQMNMNGDHLRISTDQTPLLKYIAGHAEHHWLVWVGYNCERTAGTYLQLNSDGSIERMMQTPTGEMVHVGTIKPKES